MDETLLGLAGFGWLAFMEKLLPIPPSHVLLMLLGMSSVSGVEELAVVTLVTALGSTVGSLFWLAMGRWLGPARADALARRFGKYVFLPHATYQRLAQSYRRDHFRVTLLAQLVPVARIYLAIPAGALQIAALPFIVATLLGSLLWNAVFLAGGYIMRDGAQDPFAIGFRIVAVVFVMEAALFLIVRFRIASRLSELKFFSALQRKAQLGLVRRRS